MGKGKSERTLYHCLGISFSSRIILVCSMDILHHIASTKNQTSMYLSVIYFTFPVFISYYTPSNKRLFLESILLVRYDY